MSSAGSAATCTMMTSLALASLVIHALSKISEVAADVGVGR